MKIIALMTVRNEERYIQRCLEHLELQGVDVCLIDNGSTDRTVQIAEQFLTRNVIRIEHFPYEGYFALMPILRNEERLAEELDADWFIHHDADEIREAPAPFKTLKEGFEAADAQGYNAINFDEFVFLPTVEAPDHSGADYVESMQHYYFFQPRETRRINGWKKQPFRVNLVQAAGHRVEFEGRKLFPHSFVLRHYISLSHGHAIAKYCGRVYSEKEKADHNWHGSRVSLTPQEINLPRQDQLICLTPDGWDKSSPELKHGYLGMSRTKKSDLSDQGKATLLGRIKQMLGLSPRPAPALGAIDTPFVTSRAREGAAPVPFVLGVGRSGSTLLRLMLDAHPDLAIPWETHFLRDLRKLGRNRANNVADFHRTIIQHHSWVDFHLDADVFKTRLFALDPFSCADGLRTFYELYAEKFNKPRWGDKTPTHDAFMDELDAMLPEARFIHLIRDGRDVALSHKGKWFGPGNDMKAQAADWVTRIRKCRRLAQNLEYYLEIHYEELVSDPESVLKRICEFIDLPYSPEMLDYHKTAEARLSELVTRPAGGSGEELKHEKRVGIFELTKEPPQKSRIARWRNEMTEQERRDYESVAGDMLRDLGY